MRQACVCKPAISDSLYLQWAPRNLAHHSLPKFGHILLVVGTAVCRTVVTQQAVIGGGLEVLCGWRTIETLLFYNHMLTQATAYLCLMHDNSSANCCSYGTLLGRVMVFCAGYGANLLATQKSCCEYKLVIGVIPDLHFCWGCGLRDYRDVILCV